MSKICHLIWQLITGHVAVTRNLVRRNMRCDNYCPRCGEPEESVTHTIFECPPALQAWSLSAIPTSLYIFPKPSIYGNMDYLFWRKNNIVEIELDRDPYPWIIWYIWKARKDKLFRGIDRDPMELVWYAESECQALFNETEMVPPMIQDHNTEESQVISLSNICMIDGSWTSTSQFSGCGWAWVGQPWEGSTYGDTEPLSTRITHAFRSISTTMGNGEYASTFDMPELWKKL